MLINEYLTQNGIDSVEELVGRKVFFVFPRQGIKDSTIRKILYGKHREWTICIPETYKVSELGEGIFFTKEEAEKYQLDQLEKYTKEQRDRVIKQKVQERNAELEELYRLLKKYPTSESRHLIENPCQLCSHRNEDSVYREIPVYLCSVCNKCNMFDYDFDRLKELFGE